jgi:hypothetical protein
VEEDQARPGQILNAEQVQLRTELAVVALLRLFDLVQVLFEFLLGEERRAIDALALPVVLVAFPVRAGDRNR